MCPFPSVEAPPLVTLTVLPLAFASALLPLAVFALALALLFFAFYQGYHRRP